MNSTSTTWEDSWRLQPAEYLSNAQALERLDYALEWRQWLWRRPARELFEPFEQFRGKRLLELGARYGRLSCLLAAVGAKVTGVDVDSAAIVGARDEARRWGVEQRVSFLAYDGDCRSLPKGEFDFVITKSVLVMIPRVHYQHCLEGLRDCLAPGGIGLFLENSNTRFNDWVRRRLVYRGSQRLDELHWAFYPEQIEHLKTLFGPMQVRRHYRMIWSMRTVGTAARPATVGRT